MCDNSESPSGCSWHSSLNDSLETITQGILWFWNQWQYGLPVSPPSSHRYLKGQNVEQNKMQVTKLLMCFEWKCWDYEEEVVKCTLGVWEWPRLQPCELMKDALWLSLPGRHRGWPCPPEVGRMAVRGHKDRKQLLSKHQYPPLPQGIFQFRKWPYSKITKWHVARPKIHIQSVVMDYLLHFLI